MGRIKEENTFDKLTIEETFDALDEVMDKLSDDSVSLEDSFELYKDGMKMLEHCRKIIDDVEKRVITLSTENGVGEDEE